MKECSKSIPRRLRDSNFIRKYFIGDGVDIGGKPDPLSLYLEFFPLCKSIRVWDKEDGDAQFMKSVADNTFDFVSSSHCLEHLYDPAEGLGNWLRVIKPGGHMIVTIPDEDMYEQGVFPSEFNTDHKNTFTVFKPSSWSGHSINVIDLLRTLGPKADIIKIEQINENYRNNLPRFDQTVTPVTECAIEFIVRKRPDAEVENRGRIPMKEDIDSNQRVYFNQYINDQAELVKFSKKQAPFQDNSPLIKD